MYLGGLPAILDILVITVVAVRLWACADRVVDGLAAQLHHLRRKGGRVPAGVLLPRRRWGTSARHPSSRVR